MQIDPEKCAGCFGCLNFCPVTAISIIDSRPYIDQHLCVECGTCVEACGLGGPDVSCRFPQFILFTEENKPAVY